MWPAHRGIVLRLTIIDSDGNEDTRTLTWTPVTDIKSKVAVVSLVNRIKELPFWTAAQLGDEISIGVSDPEHHSGTVVMELV